VKNTDKFLVGIVAGIVVLVVVALLLTLTRPGESYRADDTPEGVVHNYLLALQKGDYERAYSYLSPNILAGLPETVEEFTDDIQNAEWEFRFDQDSSLTVQSTQMLSSTRENVEVHETNASMGGLFDSSPYTNSFKMRLILNDGQWRIYDGDRYFLWCWREIRGCHD